MGGSGRDLKRPRSPSFPLTLTSEAPLLWSLELAEVWKRLCELLGVGGEERVPLTWSLSPGAHLSNSEENAGGGVCVCL